MDAKQLDLISKSKDQNELCPYCIHKPVCTYYNKYKELQNKIEITYQECMCNSSIKEETLKKIFSYKINCAYFQVPPDVPRAFCG